MADNHKSPVYPPYTVELALERALNDPIAPLRQIEYGLYGDLMIIYSKPYSIYLRGIISLSPKP